MTVAYFVDETDLTLAVVTRRLAREAEARKRRWRRLVAVGIVLSAHTLLIGYLVHAKLINAVPEKAPPKTELLWLLLPPAKVASGVRKTEERDKMVREAYKAVEMLPQTTYERPNAITIEPGLALGDAIACGAGSYEYLTPDGRLRCRHRPWNFTYDRYGYVILDTQGLVRKPEKTRPSDVMAHERNTAPRDPSSYIDPNAPCLDCIIRGN